MLVDLESEVLFDVYLFDIAGTVVWTPLVFCVLNVFDTAFTGIMIITSVYNTNLNCTPPAGKNFLSCCSCYRKPLSLNP